MFSAALLTVFLAAAPTPSKPPRLTLFITVDALGTDLFLRNKAHYKNGIGNLLSQGAFYPNAKYEQAEPVTSAGHTILATGAYPWRHGVVGNRIINRATGKVEPIFVDPSHPVLEAPLSQEDVSPDRLMAETLSDRLRLTTQGRGKAIAIASKGRAAIAQAGHLGQPYWFNEPVGKFVTGTYYEKEFPAWVKAFNEKKVPDSYFGKSWELSLPAKEYVGQDDRSFEVNWSGLGKVFPHPLSGGLTSAGPDARKALEATPLMSDLLVQFAKAAIEGEQLGKDDVPDMLFVSFSPIDRIYHFFGPYSWEMQDGLARLDKSVGDLIAAAEKAAGGKQNLLVVFTADHGGAAIAEEWTAAGLPASRVKPKGLTAALNKELKAKFGAELAFGIEETDLYLNDRAIADHKLDGAAVRRFCAQWLATQPGIAFAVARDDLNQADELTGYLPAIRRSYYPGRSGDVLVILKPFNVMTDEEGGASHAQPYAYDNQVPVVFSGHGVKPGVYREEIHPVDVAPTVASILEMGFPAQCEGVPRAEMMSGSAGK